MKRLRAHVAFTEQTDAEVFETLRQVTRSGGEDASEIPRQARTRYTQADWAIDENRMTLRVRPQRGSITGIVREVHMLADASRLRVLTEYEDKSRPEFGIYHTGLEAPRTAQIKNGIWNAWHDLDPRRYVFYLGSTPLDELLRSTKGAIVRPSTVYGSSCWQVDVAQPDNTMLRFDVDAQHGLVRRRCDFVRVGGKNRLIRLIEIPALQKSNGPSMPSEVRVTVLVQPSKDDTSEVAPEVAVKKGPGIRKTIRITTRHADEDLPEALFKLDWPVGTQVQDIATRQMTTLYALSPTESRAVDELRRTQAQANVKSQEGTALPRAQEDTASSIAQATPRVRAGEEAPGFQAADANGKMWNLKSLQGRKNVLLTFFPKCFTGGCANHLSSLRDQQAAFDASSTQILAVSIDSSEGERGQKAFAAQWQLAFPLIPDTRRTLSMLFGATQNERQLSARMSVLIDKKGVVRLIDTSVNVRTHGLDVLAKIKELGLDK